MALTAIFFDAGNTLVFADPARTLAPLQARGVRPTRDQLHAAERAAKQRLQEALRTGDHSVDKHFWDVYYGHLLEALGCAEDGLCQELVSATRRSGNWCVVLPGTREL